MIFSSGRNRLVIGNVTKDAEYKLVGEKQSAMCRFGIAADKDKDDQTVFVNVVAWRRWAEVTAGLRKGDSVLVAGHIESREYEGKKYYDLVADFVIPGTRPDGQRQEADKPKARTAEKQQESVLEQVRAELEACADDLPF